MKKNNSIINFLIIFIIIQIITFIYIEIKHHTPNEVDIYETIIINLITGSLVSLLISYREYILCKEEQDSIFLSRLFDYYNWLRQFKNNVNEIKRSRNYNLIYNEYKDRLKFLKKDREQNDVYYFIKYLELFDLQELSSGFKFLSFEMKINIYEVNNTDAFEILKSLDKLIDDEINMIDFKIKNVKHKSIKSGWNLYISICKSNF